MLTCDVSFIIKAYLILDENTDYSKYDYCIGVKAKNKIIILKSVHITKFFKDNTFSIFKLLLMFIFFF